MRNVLVYLFLFLSYNLIAQSEIHSQEEFKGIWKGVSRVKEPMSDISKRYLIYNNDKLLKFKLNSKYGVYVKNFWFSNEDEDESIKANGKLSTPGRYYVQSIENSMEEMSSSLGNYYEIGKGYEGEDDDDYLILFYNRYKKLDRLPKLVLSWLYQQSKYDKRNYILEFLEIDIREIISSNALIYNDQKEKRNEYLSKGDIIEILSIDSGFVHFNFLRNDETVITGFIRPSDINNTPF